MGKLEDCLFCNEQAMFIMQGSNYKVECPNCGVYYISEEMYDRDADFVKKYSDSKYLISGLIREKNELGLDIGIIKHENIIRIINDSIIPRTITEKLEKILLYLYRNQEIIGEKKIVYIDKYAIGYARNYEEFSNLIRALIDLELLNGSILSGEVLFFSGRLSLSGIIRCEELSSTNIYTNKVFVAMGFHKDLLEAHEKAIRPACKECDFDAQLITDTEHNEGITDRIIAEIKTSRFMITDFTYNNYGAYFEAGYAQGRGLEVIRTCKKEWFDAKDKNGKNINRVHFDIQHYNFILWEDCDDLREKLYNRIRATIL